MKLRPYQEQLIFDIKQQLKKGIKSVCAVAGCGSGKSVVQGMISRSAAAKKNHVLFIVHRKELYSQIEETFTKCGVNFDYCKLGMVQTIVRQLDKIQKPDIIITDENHHCLARSYRKIYETFPNAILLGFTATPIRLNGDGLGDVYQEIVESESIKWLINNKFLAPYRLYSIKLANTDNVKIERGEYKKTDINQIMEDRKIYGDTVENYKKLAVGKKTIIYCASIESSRNTSAEFNSNGIVSAHLDGTTPKIQREETVNKFRSGEISILSNVDLFGEGFDVPDCECVILLRPTMSLSLYIQQSMRAMRYQERKEAIIIDHVGNCFRHGLPDQEREWSLEKKPKKKKRNSEDQEEKIRECPQCFAVIEINIKICPNCGHEFNASKKELEVEKAELQEISSDYMLKHAPYNYHKQIRKLSDLIKFAEFRNYKLGWVMMKLEENNNYVCTIEDFKYIQKQKKYKNPWWKHQADKYIKNT